MLFFDWCMKGWSMLISWCLWTNHRWTNRWSWLDWSSSGGIGRVVLYLLQWHLYTHSILLLMFSGVHLWVVTPSFQQLDVSCELGWDDSTKRLTLIVYRKIHRISIFQAFIRLKRWKVMSSPKQSRLWKIGGWIMLPGSWKGSLYGKPDDMMYSAIMYDIFGSSVNLGWTCPIQEFATQAQCLLALVNIVQLWHVLRYWAGAFPSTNFHPLLIDL